MRIISSYVGSSIEEVIDKIQRPKKPLKNARLTAAKIEPIQGVHVMNMDDGKCDEGFLELYFSNEKRSGGGSVQEVRLIGRGEAIITFEKPEGWFSHCMRSCRVMCLRLILSS